MAFDNVAIVVAAVVALANDALIALDLLPERVFATGEYQTHRALKGGLVAAGLLATRCTSDFDLSTLSRCMKRNTEEVSECRMGYVLVFC